MDGEILGLAHNLTDVAEFLRRAGLEIDAAEVAQSPWIEWKGAGPSGGGRRGESGDWSEAFRVLLHFFDNHQPGIRHRGGKIE